MDKEHCPKCGRFCKVSNTIQTIDPFSGLTWKFTFLNTLWVKCKCKSGKDKDE